MQRPSNFAERDDARLIAACLNGETGAWEALITRYQRLIYSIPLKARLSQDDAADIFQAVCLKLFEKLSTLREHEKLVSWLITTTTRECWRLSARLRRETSSSDKEEGGTITEAPDTALLADEQRQKLQEQQLVREAISALPDRCRDLLTMLFYQKDELSYVDVARRMSMPVASIGPTRARCLDKLRKLLNGKI